ncbi:HCLS1-binding protein 3 isoform X4 [Heptranchias perlo]|uniref:HCLS1-binding protein 3 isoform X4 n=1 Tax=Heptranchias perlo TaxID=212740 RepID=UPI0035593781
MLNCSRLGRAASHYLSLSKSPLPSTSSPPDHSRTSPGSLSSAHKCIRQVTDCLFRRVSQYVNFPVDDLSQTERAVGFHTVASFPRVQQSEHLHMSQDCPSTLSSFVTTAKDSFTCAPDSLAAATILRESNVPGPFHAPNTLKGWLLGDQGYPLQTWLTTPLRNPITDQQHRYNDSHIATRSTIEHAIGLLKVSKKYSEIDDLFQKLSTQYPKANVPSMPRKVLFVGESDIKERRVAFDEIFRFIAKDTTLATSSELLDFLGAKTKDLGDLKARNATDELQEDEGESGDFFNQDTSKDIGKSRSSKTHVPTVEKSEETSDPLGVTRYSDGAVWILWVLSICFLVM